MLYLLMGLVVTLLLAALVINWAYLVLVQRDMQFRTDLIALAAAPALLDEDVLMDRPQEQFDDLGDANATAHLYREMNNARTSRFLQLESGDLDVSPGSIATSSAGLSTSGFQAAGPFNALRITAKRSSQGSRPVAWLVNTFWSEGAVDVAARSYAALNNRVIGFQPTMESPSPVLPLAIDVQSWRIHRGRDMYPIAGNGIKELHVQLGQSEQGGTPIGNMVLVSFDGPLTSWVVLQQIADGLKPTDLPAPNHDLGPVTAWAEPLVLHGEQAVDSLMHNEVSLRLQRLSPANGEIPRVFPLFDSADPLTQPSDGKFRIVGFVAGKIISSTIGTDVVRFVVEPCFLIHPTAWIHASGEPNPFIHKLQIIR